MRWLPALPPYMPPRKSVLRFFLVACVSLLEVLKDLKGVQNVLLYLWPPNSINLLCPLLHQVPFRILLILLIYKY